MQNVQKGVIRTYWTKIFLCAKKQSAHNNVNKLTVIIISKLNVDLHYIGIYRINY